MDNGRLRMLRSATVHGRSNADGTARRRIYRAREKIVHFCDRGRSRSRRSRRDSPGEERRWSAPVTGFAGRRQSRFIAATGDGRGPKLSPKNCGRFRENFPALTLFSRKFRDIFFLKMVGLRQTSLGQVEISMVMAKALNINVLQIELAQSGSESVKVGQTGSNRYGEIQSASRRRAGAALWRAAKAEGQAHFKSFCAVRWSLDNASASCSAKALHRFRLFSLPWRVVGFVIEKSDFIQVNRT